MKSSNYKTDSAFAKSVEPTLDGWYHKWTGCFWREPPGTLRQRAGVDVNFLDPDATPESIVWTIDEKVSRLDTGNLVFEVEQGDGVPGWGATAVNDILLYCVVCEDNIRAWWIGMDNLRRYSAYFPDKIVSFKYEGYSRQTTVKLIPLSRLVGAGIAIGPLELTNEVS